MHLKNIELQGFKSFADKISLDFNKGITAIVGPNGSGKSNISDAIRWVMGEQSVKSLRGSKMEDVIFAGTEVRKALGFAEVSLTIDNEEGVFPVNFSEVTVTRRVYRSGESEYYINKASCRLKDIHELFMDTGLGREGYSVVGQGKIDEILSVKSEDRRQVFEEAAGITKYKYRKHEAEKKLNSTEDNLVRLRDIMAEIEANLTPLEMQSEKAKKFLNLREELKVLELNVSIEAIDKYRKILSEIDTDFEAVGGQLEQVKAKIEEMDKELEKMYAITASCDNEMEENRQNEKEIENSINSCINEINMFDMNIKHNAENISRLKSETDKGKQDMQAFDNEYKVNEKILSDFQAENEKIQKNIDELTEQSSSASGFADGKNEEIEAIKSDVIDKMNTANNIKSTVSNLNILTDNYTQRLSAVENEIEEKSTGQTEIKNKIAGLEAEIKDKSVLIENSRAETNKISVEIKQKRAEFDTLSAQKNSDTLELNSNVSKKNLLEDMDKNFEGYVKSVKGVMTAYGKGYLKNAKIHGPLSQLIKTEDKFINAVEVALGASAQNIVVESENDGKEAIEYLKRNNLGRATFLPLSSVRGREMDRGEVNEIRGFLGIASTLVKFDNKYANIVKSVLGRTVVFDNIDNAISAAKKSGYKYRIVTLAGDVLQAGGAMTGGSMGKGSGFLSRSAEIEALTVHIEKLQKKIKEDSILHGKLGEQINALQSDGELKSKELTATEQDLVKLSTDMAHYKTFLENARTDAERLEAEKSSIHAQIEKIANDIKEKEADVERIQADISGLQNGMAMKQEEFERFSKQRDDISAKLMEFNIQRNNVLKDIEVQNERMQKINADKQEVLEEIALKQEEIEELEDKNDNMNSDIEFKKQQIEDLKAEAAKNSEKMAVLTQRKHETDESIKKHQSDSKDIRETMFNVQQEYSRTENKKTKTELELENVTNRMWDEYELTYSGALEYKKDIGSLSAAQKRIQEIRDAIKELGNINIDAIEEYKTTLERFEFLSGQISDLDKAKADLEKIIEEMVAIMQKQFSEQFAVINENFGDVFRELFGGGQAAIKLTDPDNVLESGIEIEAQPPGKKLQNLSLLSGGERAFTAIALLFAILKVRPTPFCILDEIEAALDDVNVYRFADYLRRYSKGTQFIVVTHRRGTMECANGLYGVTMQEKGISKILSLNIDEVAQEIAI